MAIIVRENRTLAGVLVQRVKVYKSIRPVTAESQMQADELDRLLEVKMKFIEQKMKETGLLGLKGKPGVIKLWYEVGRHLDFVNGLRITPEEDRKYVWRALYDHGGELVPGSGQSRRERYENSHFKYCALVARFPWEFVQAAGDWTSWVEFLDSEKIREDERIIEWLRQRSTEKPSREWLEFTQGMRQRWFRKLTKLIRHRFKNSVTAGILSDKELFEELDQVFSEASNS